MKTFSLLASASLALAVKELSFSKEDYQSGAVHQSIMETKHASWDRQRAAGEMESSQYPSLQVASVKCEGGLAVVEAGNANQTFSKCHKRRVTTSTS